MGSRRYSFFSSAIAFGLCVTLLATSGCSVRNKAVSALAEALSGNTSLVFTGESDPVLVEESFPFILKAYEALIEQQPENRSLLAATGKAFTLYTFAFVQSPADMLDETRGSQRKAMQDRAKMLYQRGRDYLFDALELSHPDIRTAIIKGNADSALATVTIGDTTELYWAGVAWMGQLTAGTPGLSAVFNLRKAAALIHKVLELDETYDKGAAHEALIAYYGLLPKSMGGSEEKAREHFERAVALSDSTRARPYVMLAKSVALRNGDREAFEALLRRALAVDTDKRTPDRLANVISQQTARELLERADALFARNE